VLDAPVAPIADVTEQASRQFDAFLEAQDAFFADCESRELNCPADAENLFETVVATIPEEDDRTVFLSNWKLMLSAPPGRALLAEVLRTLAGGPMTAMADMPMMAPVDVLSGINALANFSTNCADSAVAPLTASEAEALLESFRQRSPLFADQGIAAVTCSGWQVMPDPVPALTALRVPPLVIGGLQDSLTPFVWPEQTVAAIPGSRLLRSEHYGHGATLSGSSCVFNYIKQYLDTLEPVAAGARCAAPTVP
jgi:pimeloyl-ACP methyl ester carboxylesterase